MNENQTTETAELEKVGLIEAAPRRRLRLGAALLALGLVAAACGSDGSDGTTPTGDDTTDADMSDDEMSDDEMSDDMSDDEMHEDDMSEDDMSDDDMSEEMSDDEG